MTDSDISRRDDKTAETEKAVNHVVFDDVIATVGKRDAWRFHKSIDASLDIMPHLLSRDVWIDAKKGKNYYKGELPLLLNGSLRDVTPEATTGGNIVVFKASNAAELSIVVNTKRGQQAQVQIGDEEGVQAVPSETPSDTDPLYLDLAMHQRRRRSRGFWSGVADLMRLPSQSRRGDDQARSLERAYADLALAAAMGNEGRPRARSRRSYSGVVHDNGHVRLHRRW